MHDIFESALLKVFPLLLKSLEQQYPALGLQSSVESETWRIGNVNITVYPEYAIKGTASQIDEFFYRLPKIIGHIIEEKNLHWQLYLIVREFCRIALSNCSDLGSLNELSTSFLQNFVKIYEDEKVTPKMQHLLHYEE